MYRTYICTYLCTYLHINKHFVGGYTESEGDYVYQNYSYTLNSTADQCLVIIRPVDDNIVEPDENFTLTFSLVGKRDHFLLVNERVTVTIFNDDGM